MIDIRRWPGLPLEAHARALAAEFLRQTERAGEVQRARLLHLVRRHADSQFGRDHHFAEIRTPADFRRRVPIRGYDGHEPYIARVRQGDVSALFGPGTEILMFALTSGTTATPKTIPVTREALQNYRDGWTIWGIRAFDDHFEILRRGLMAILQIASDWRETTTPAGIPCGAITGLTAHMQNPLVRITYCMPAIAARIKDVESKYYVALRVSAYRNLGAIIAANPSTLLAIARLADREQETLIRDLYNGTLDPKWPIPPEIRAALRFRTRWKRRRAARRLEAIAARTGRLRPVDLWPNLQFLANWTGGTMGAYLRHYPEYFGATPVRDPGLIASEGRMTIPIEDGTPAGILDIRHHYFEFLPEEQVDREEPEVVEATDLIEGRRYFLLPTTAGGLYRYQIFDLVRCVGFQGKAPVLEFLNKGAHFSSLTGEKLSEFQVVEAVNAAAPRAGVRLKSFLMLPTWGEPPSYSLLVEADDLPGEEAAERLAAEVDAELSRVNVEYENKRSTLRLGPIRTRRIPVGSWAEFQRRRLAQSGGTVEQYKQPCLMPDLSAIASFRFCDEETTTRAESM
ncbi:MAG: GH3 auxin-responsive promoter family protein [Isosphaeraceae bacterium]|nr:GH3 auxin-responsive promoter family protein [Isosphaeraceae bacterium]